MTDTLGMNAREKAAPRKIEPRDRTAMPVDAASPPALEPSAAPAQKLHPIDEAAYQATRLASEEELARHVEALGPGFRREPFGRRAMRLAAPQRSGFHRHWFNDRPGRIADALRKGYTMVKDDAGEPIKRTVGVSARGDGQTGYLMEIPVQWYLEDMRALERAADEVEATIRRNEVLAGDGGHRYIPREQGNEAIRTEVERRGSPLAPLVNG